jgi:DMATS type aromatic prenyltransferase
MLAEVLGPAGERGVCLPPRWPSNVADDGTPVEFSIALDRGRAPTPRILAEVVAAEPSRRSNLDAALRCLAAWRDRGLAYTGGFDRVRDLFLVEENQGLFPLWYSLVAHPGGRPTVKAYFDPAARGAAYAADLVADALRRLGFGPAVDTVLDHAALAHRSGSGDRFSFLSVDLHEGPGSRAKVYVSHRGSSAEAAVRASRAVPGVDGEQIAEFCALLAGREGPFHQRPLISAYTFVGGDTDRPSRYSVYLPVRGYVTDDAQARQRVVRLFDRYGYDVGLLDAALAALTDRPLTGGVGLIAHVALRFGPDVPGVTVYLSSEAYRVMPPRPASTPTPHDGGARRATHVRE